MQCKNVVSVSEYLQLIFQDGVVIPAVELSPDGTFDGVKIEHHINRPLASAADAAAWIDECDNEYVSGVRLGLVIGNEKSQKPAKQGYIPQFEGLSAQMRAGAEYTLRF